MAVNQTEVERAGRCLIEEVTGSWGEKSVDAIEQLARVETPGWRG